MMAMKRGKRGILSIYVPTRAGGLVQRSTGTNDAKVVRGMARMVREFKDAHRWALLDALTIATVVRAKRKVPALTLKRCYTYYASSRLGELESELSSANLAAHLDAWIAWVRAQRREGVRTADVYWQQVTTLVPPGGSFLSNQLTKATVIAWLAGREKASSGTRRKYLYALKSFVRYLVDAGVLPADPLAGLKAPKKNAARERWVSAALDEKIVKSSIAQYRALFAYIKGTGCDVGSALRAQRGDVRLFAKRADIRGTKTDRRRVHGADIEPWAIKYLDRRAIASEPKHELLFPGLNRNGATKHHARVCATIGVRDYTLKDSRHSVGVRMRKAGKSFELIAAQLGSSVYQIVSVYTKYDVEADIAREAK